MPYGLLDPCDGRPPSHLLMNSKLLLQLVDSRLYRFGRKQAARAGLRHNEVVRICETLPLTLGWLRPGAPFRL